MQLGKVPTIVGGVVAVLAAVVVVSISGCSGKDTKTENKPIEASVAAGAAAKSGDPVASETVALNDTQVKSIEVGPAGERTFSQQRTAVGSIDFNENLAVQVFAPYQGKIIKAYAEIGDEVVKGATLYTIDSPDLVQAESTLIAAAGVYDLTTAALKRAKELYETQGLAQKDYQQAVSDQQTADAALKAGHDAVRVFGKSEAEISEIVSKHKIDSSLVVPSPITGKVTARFAQPGLLVQPGNAPAPYTIADVSTMWMIANVTESDSPLFHAGQDAKVRVMAFPGRDFEGKISVIGATVDPNLHTVVVRSQISDPKHELRSGMLANFVIRTGDPISTVAVPLDGVAREGDGTMSVWATTDRHHFTRHIVKLGLQQDGFDQVLSGLRAGELVVTKGAILLSNMLNAPPSD
ncbi:MAG TPA: efflux RND transporter periplasmic adaptor subunit [Burkholderiaceae bacterium]|nr:efflux RND transporter periplasmic adaptor subunit [Burkholderiaceae bacterium]